MTLIECFDSSPIENIIATLKLKPDRVVFIGNEKKMNREVERYRVLLKNRNINPVINLYDLKKNENIADILIKFIENEDECVLDLTGGEEATIFTIAMTISELDDTLREKVSIQRFNFNTFASDCDSDGDFFKGTPANLTVRELIELYGGKIHPETEQPDKCYTPENINRLWNAMRNNPKNWNKMISALNEFESQTTGDTIQFSLSDKKKDISNFEYKEKLFKNALTKLRLNDIIIDNSGRDRICYTYKNPLYHECVKKQGNLLEMKVFLEARAFKENGTPFFNDCRMSVNIDWDGITTGSPNTRNEIDIILMKDATPIFVSCKNGNIPEEELYKLHTVAEEFGGEYAKKMLIATSLDGTTSFPLGFVQRAKDMGIILIQNARSFEKQDWEQAFRKIFEN